MDCQLSIIINVKNGEATLDRCLSALSRFNDIVVFDNYSTDKTLEIATKYSNVNIIQHEFCGMGKVRNLAAEHAKNAWILFVDCDEVVHPDLVDTLLSYRFSLGTVYSVLRHNFYSNMWVDSSAWENDWVVRVYNRHETKYTEARVHEGVIQDKLILKQIKPGFIYHFPYNSVSGLIDKMQTYSSWYANGHYPNKKPALWGIPFRALLMFLKCYILKRGFLDGFSGFAISSYNAIGVFSKYIKLYELYYNKVIGLVLFIDELGQLANLVKKINQQTFLPQYIYIMLAKDTLLADGQDKLIEYLGSLSIPHEIVDISQNPFNKNQWQEYFKDTDNLDYLLLIEDSCLFNSINSLKKCKKAILARKKLDKIDVINLR